MDSDEAEYIAGCLREVEGVNVHWRALQKYSKDYYDKNKITKIEIPIGVEDFKFAMNREPNNDEELQEFIRAVEKGVEGQLEWGLLYSDAADVVRRDFLKSKGVV